MLVLTQRCKALTESRVIRACLLTATFNVCNSLFVHTIQALLLRMPSVLLIMDLGTVTKYKYVIPERNIRKTKRKVPNEVKSNLKAID